MKCSNCGSEISPEQKFCVQCGKPVNNNIKENVITNNVNNSSINKDKNTKVGIIIFVIVIVLAVIVGTVMFFVNKAFNTAKDIIVGTSNTIEDMAEDIYDEIENTYEEMEKELVTKLEWKTPFVKIDKENSNVKSLFSVNKSLEDLSEYDVYGAIIKINYNKFYHIFENISCNDANVVYDTGKRMYTDNETTYYYPVYIAVENGKSIDNIELIIDNNEENILETSENNVTAITGEKTATYGDCLTFTLDGCRTYMILLDINKNASSGGGWSSNYPGENYDTVGADIEVLYITEGKPENDYVDAQDLLKTVSKDSNIIATNVDEDRKYEQEIYIDDTKFYIKPSGSNTITVEYLYKEGLKEVNEARKVFDNEKIKLKLLDTTIEIMNNEEE